MVVRLAVSVIEHSPDGLLHPIYVTRVIPNSSPVIDLEMRALAPC